MRARRSASLCHIEPGDLRQFDLDLETDLRRLSSKVPPPATISSSDIHIRQGALQTCQRCLSIVRMQEHLQSPCLHSKHSQTSVTCLFTAETYLTASGRCTSTARADCSTTAPRCSAPAGSRPATSSRPGTFVLVPAPRLPPPSRPGTCNCATQKQASSFIQCLCHLYLIESLEDFNTVRVILNCSATVEL